MILAIDFDNVIHASNHPKPGMKMGPPMEGALETLTKWHQARHTIIVHSVRGGRPQHIEDWMNYYKIPFDTVTNIKPAADIYIDDKGFRFVSWGQINEIEEILAS